MKHVREVHIEEIDEETNKKVEYYIHYALKGINYVIVKQIKILDDHFEPIKFQVIKPRFQDLIYVRPANKRPRTPWTFPISIFKDYRIENEELLMECFEFDWSSMKFPKLTEEEMAAVKEELRKAYRTM